VKILNKIGWILFELLITQSMHPKPTDGVEQLLDLLSLLVTQVKITQRVDIQINSSNKRKCNLQYINKLLIINLKHQLLIMIKTPK
jgi:hypothetical protein